MFTKELFIVLSLSLTGSIHDMRDTHYIIFWKTIDYCFSGVATQWKLLTEDYVMGAVHIRN